MRAAILGLALPFAFAAGCAGDMGSPAPDRGATYGVEGGTFGVDVSVWSEPITDTEMDCFWDAGVRHVIVGTQELGTARQQMDMAVAHGMTVDAYVYLMWDGNVRRQVETALGFARSYPIGKLWLDVEQDAAGRGRGELEDLIQTAVDACGSYPCGIYTAEWWWTPNMGTSEIVSDLPLWYAIYDHDPSAGTWATQRFGGWSEPWGKQYDGDVRLCGIDVDLNTIRVTTHPTRPHVTPPAPPAGAPARPIGLWPASYSVVPSWLDVRMLANGVPGATGYDFAIEYWNGSRYSDYYTYAGRTNARSFSPRFAGTTYRFHVRASNGSGSSAWSDWAYFQYGSATAHPPEPGATEPPPSEPPPSEPPPSEPPPSEPPSEPPPPAAPGAPSPSDGARVTTDSVTLTRGPVSGATRYEHEIDYHDGARFARYYTYAGASDRRTFWPTYRDTEYRWRVRATTAAGVGAWSAYAAFTFGTATATPPAEPPPPEPPPPATAGVPAGLAPNGGTITTLAVTLSSSPVAGATSYEFAIEYSVAGTFRSYYTYTATAPSKTVYPATHGTQYRFRMRARTAAGWGGYSAYATFDYR